MIEKIKKFFTKKKIIIGSIALVIIILIVIFSSGKKDAIAYSTVEKGTIIQEVSITGKVKSTKSVDLAFEKGGRVSGVFADVGSKVVSGQKLVELESADLRANLLQSQAKLNELIKGTRQEEIDITQSDLKKAKQDLENYKIDAVDVLNDSYVKADEAVRNRLDPIFNNDESLSPKLSYTALDSQQQINAETLRLSSKDVLNKWTNDLRVVRSSNSLVEIKNNLNNAKTYLNTTLDLFSAVQITLQNSPNIPNTNSDTYQTTLDTFKAVATLGRSGIITALSNINNQTQLIENQEISISRKEKELTLQLAGNTNETIQAQQAQVMNYLALLEKNILRAPFDGVITKKDATVGEIISSNNNVMSIIGVGAFEMEASISESDVSKIKVGDQAKVTLDAYGSNVVWEAQVIDIDMAETVVDGVPTYKARFQFKTEDERVRSGFTANIDVLAQKKDNVLFVPSRSITTIDGKQYVKILKDTQGTTEEINVIVGLRGSDGRTEIVSNLKEGDRILTN